jgi:hypothetical protein
MQQVCARALGVGRPPEDRRSLLRGCLRGTGEECVQAWLPGSPGHGVHATYLN